MNSDIFNIKRFGSYLGSEIRNAISKFGYSGLACALGSLIVYIMSAFFSLVIARHGWYSADITSRMFCFILIMVAVLIQAPKKIYGGITDKKEGSIFLTVPVSTLEKALSMIIVSCIIVPGVCMAAYISVDSLLCLFDKNCGTSVISSMFHGLGNAIATIADFPEELSGIKELLNPLVYIDDMIQVGMIFLLGSIFFKTSKISKTILSLIAFGFVSSMIMTPIVLHGIGPLDLNITNDAEALEFINEKMGFIGFTLKHGVLIDTISDTITCLLLATGIYFRVKTLKF